MWLGVSLWYRYVFTCQDKPHQPQQPTGPAVIDEAVHGDILNKKGSNHIALKERKRKMQNNTNKPTVSVEVELTAKGKVVFNNLKAELVDKSNKFNKGQIYVAIKLPNGFICETRLSSDEVQLVKLTGKKTFDASIVEALEANADGWKWVRIDVQLDPDYRKGFFIKGAALIAYKKLANK